MKLLSKLKINIDPELWDSGSSARCTIWEQNTITGKWTARYWTPAEPLPLASGYGDGVWVQIGTSAKTACGVLKAVNGNEWTVDQPSHYQFVNYPRAPGFEIPEWASYAIMVVAQGAYRSLGEGAVTFTIDPNQPVQSTTTTQEVNVNQGGCLGPIKLETFGQWVTRRRELVATGDRP